MDNIVIFGLDIDDCLSLEYYFVQHPDGHLNIYFRGELYNHLKFSIFMGYANYGKRFLPIITSLSARASKKFDSQNILCNAIPSSALLLTALAQQLSTELNKLIILDTSFLFEQLPPATFGEGFQQILNDRLGNLSKDKENTKLDIFLDMAPSLKPVPEGKLNSQLKLLKARQSLARISDYVNNLGYKNLSFTLYFYDDIEEYLNYLTNYLQINDIPVYLRTFLVNSYIKHENNFFHLDRSEISKFSEKNVSESTASTLSWSTSSLKQLNLKPNLGFVHIKPNSMPLKIDPRYPEQILTNTTRDEEDFVAAVLRPNFGITAQEAARAEGFSWRMICPVTTTKYREYIDWKDPQN